MSDPDHVTEEERVLWRQEAERYVAAYRPGPTGMATRIVRLTEPEPPMRWADLPLAAPIWACICYAIGMMVFTAIIVSSDAITDTFMMFFACAFTFQFCTYAVYRGLRNLAKQSA